MNHVEQIKSRLPADDAVLKAGLLLCDVRQRGITSKDLIDAVNSGMYKTASVQIAGATLAFWYSQLQDGTLWVHFSIAVAGKLGANLYRAGEHLAKELGAPALLFVTKRAAMIDSAITDGYTPAGLLLAKQF